MQPWLLLTLALSWVPLKSHAAEVEFQAVFVTSPMPIRTGEVKLTTQPGLVAVLTPTAQKTLIDDLQKSSPAPEIFSLPKVTSRLQTKSVISTGERPPDVIRAQVECEAQSTTDSLIAVLLRPQVTTQLAPPVTEPQVVTVPITGSEQLDLPTAHTDTLLLRTLVRTDLPSGHWALIYLGKTSVQDVLPHYHYAFVSGIVVP